MEEERNFFDTREEWEKAIYSQNPLRASRSPELFPALFDTWVWWSSLQRRNKMSAPSTPRGRKRSRASPPREYLTSLPLFASLIVYFSYFGEWLAEASVKQKCTAQVCNQSDSIDRVKTLRIACKRFNSRLFIAAFDRKPFDNWRILSLVEVFKFSKELICFDDEIFNLLWVNLRARWPCIIYIFSTTVYKTPCHFGNSLKETNFRPLR